MSNALSMALGAAAGTSPPTQSIWSGTRDDVIGVWVGTGTSTTTGTLVTITLGSNYSSGPDEPSQVRAIAGFIGSAAQAAQCYISSVTSKSIVISCAVAPAASLSAGPSGIGIVIHVDT